MRKVIYAVLTTLAMVAGLLVGAAGPSQAGNDECDFTGNLPMSCLDTNEGVYQYVKSQIGAKPYSMTKLVKRYGSSDIDYQVAANVELAVVAITHQNDHADPVPKIKATKIPWPSYKAKSAKKYKKSRYAVYEIFGEKKNGTVITWKYGITRQKDVNVRPRSQLGKCNAYFKKHKIAAKCDFTILIQVIGWFAARSEESSLTTLYAATHGGKCPPGMPKCV
jgi:hypothetical protein